MQENFALAVGGVVILSLAPIILEVINQSKGKAANEKEGGGEDGGAAVSA